MTEKKSRDPRFFEDLYAANPDPWRFETSDYERRKYAATLAALGEARFADAFEVGCSIGVLTQLLAAQCDALLAVDIVPAALQTARVRCAALPQVTFGLMQVPAAWPEAGRTFDLIILSEMLYFLSAADIRRTAALAVASTKPGGRVLLVNYTEPNDEPHSGDEAAAIFVAAAGLPVLKQEWVETFRIDLLGR